MNPPVVNQDPTTKGHIPALDGLRGLAILLVMLGHVSFYFHYNNAFTRTIRNIIYGGWSGVDLFFVLSGFLITGILWDTRHAPHYFKNFYARRTLRIFPLYYASLILLFLIVPAATPILSYFHEPLRQIVQDRIKGFADSQPYWPLYSLYLGNVLVAWKGFDIWMTHFWSLSVEEHFYLVWPFVVHRMKLRTLIITSATLIGVTLIFRLIALPLINANAIYALTPFRMDGLALGALLAMLWRLPEQRVKVERWARLVMPIAGSILFAIICYKGNSSNFGVLPQSIGYTASILFYGSLLVRVLDTPWLNTIFRGRFLRLFGKYSYSIYIFHIILMVSAAPLFALGNPNHPSNLVHLLKRFGVSQAMPLSEPLLWLDGAVYILFVLASSVAVALTTWYLLEAPCLRLKHFFSYEKRGKLVEGADIVADLARS